MKKLTIFEMIKIAEKVQNWERKYNDWRRGEIDVTIDTIDNKEAIFYGKINNYFIKLSTWIMSGDRGEWAILYHISVQNMIDDKKQELGEIVNIFEYDIESEKGGIELKEFYDKIRKKTDEPIIEKFNVVLNEARVLVK